MLHDIYYILPSYVFQRPVTHTTDYILAWHIDADNHSHLLAAYQAASLLDDGTPFSLFVSRADKLTPQAATDIVSFFFFSNYDKPAGIPQILVHGNSTRHGLQILEEQAKAQGFSQIRVQALSTVYQANTVELIWQTYRNWLHDPVQQATSLFIQATEASDITRLHNLLKEEENLFSQQNNGLYIVKQQNKDLTRRVQELERSYNAAQQEISNQVSHVKILRSESQAAALQNYYNNEYEILPMWYKRMGHIIKVLMGKRSFKSLFKDNVKKYTS